MMVADVYAGDVDGGSVLSARTKCFAFDIEADAEPDVLLRVACQLNLANVLPASFQLRTLGARAAISAQFSALRPSVADALERKLSQLTSVHNVRCHSA